MTSENIGKVSIQVVVKDRLKVYVELLKLRLSMLVALSAVFGYAMAAGTDAFGISLLWIGLGGLLVTGASNVLNQVFEREYDKQMKRTAQRPLPTGRIGDVEAVVYALLVAIAGIFILGFFFNLATALLGIIGLLSYAFVYTPMKRISPFAVFIGAIPGGLPPLIGWVAFTGALDAGGLLLFTFQFFWQFPHFWAIAWRLDEDYKRAGFKMLPTSSGKSRSSAWLILIYTFCMVPLAYFPWQQGLVGVGGAVSLALLGVAFMVPAWKLFRTLDGKYAKQLLFASFMYLPLIQLAFLFG